MACPFVRDVVDEEALVLRRAFRRERVFRDRLDPLAFPDDHLYERYRFSADGISGAFLYSVGDAEQLNKATICRTIRSVCLAIKALADVFISFPGHRRLCDIKEEFYRIAAMLWQNGLAQSMTPESFGPLKSISAYHKVNSLVCCWETGGMAASLFLLTPFTDPQEAQQAYNHAHARTRARVEMTFGLLKARFHCLHKLRVSPVRACDITVACAVLHNVACLRKERDPRVPPAMDWDNPAIFPDDDSGRLLRDQYVLNYFS
ncbi:hypothetical protein J4Q44_G00166690 [Coregonus suidteri]|uniref:DDE Tnp4 domain-containing protein n=1 Tax=Coregonus suidteri TaxID=861788 RepID=A0AAN8LJF5_9TELE